MCGAENVYTYDTDQQSFLTPYFEELIGIYTPGNALTDNYPKDELRNLVDELDERWGIFSDEACLSYQQKLEILKAICKDLNETMPTLFVDKVGLPELFDEDYLNASALVKRNDWAAFVSEIKTENRYHSKMVNLDVLENYCNILRKEYPEGSTFFRARISDAEGYPAEKMSAPPPEKSSEGRANARGIACLYVSRRPQTTFHEVRAGELDYITIGTFRAKKKFAVVDLPGLAEISPFANDMNLIDILDLAINKENLKKVDAEMSRALRRSDSTLEYIPTQYIVDFIKSLTDEEGRIFDGVEYRSTLDKGGYNLAVFNPELLECEAVEVYRVEALEYKSEKLK